MSEFIGEEGEKYLLLVEGFDDGSIDLVCAPDELVGLRHVEDEFVADEFGGGVVGVGAV